MPLPAAPLLLILAGPNGAGKTSFFTRYLQGLGLPFVNADVIARDIFGPQAEVRAMEAMHLADEERRRLLSLSKSFIMETVLSDTGGHKIGFFKECQAAGYRIMVHFIGISSAELSSDRVSIRVSQGGHSVPPSRIASRYPRTLENLVRLFDVANRLSLYDNSSFSNPYRLLATFEEGQLAALSESLPPWTERLGLSERATIKTVSLP